MLSMMDFIVPYNGIAVGPDLYTSKGITWNQQRYENLLLWQLYFATIQN